jgi:hypothetical protein
VMAVRRRRRRGRDVMDAEAGRADTRMPWTSVAPM